MELIRRGWENGERRCEILVFLVWLMGNGSITKPCYATQHGLCSGIIHIDKCSLFGVSLSGFGTRVMLAS